MTLLIARKSLNALQSRESLLSPLSQSSVWASQQVGPGRHACSAARSLQTQGGSLHVACVGSSDTDFEPPSAALRPQTVQIQPPILRINSYGACDLRFNRVVERSSRPNEGHVILQANPRDLPSDRSSDLERQTPVPRCALLLGVRATSARVNLMAQQVAHVHTQELCPRACFCQCRANYLPTRCLVSASSQASVLRHPHVHCLRRPVQAAWYPTRPTKLQQPQPGGTLNHVAWSIGDGNACAVATAS